jgi:hypothetical protein
MTTFERQHLCAESAGHGHESGSTTQDRTMKELRAPLIVHAVPSMLKRKRLEARKPTTRISALWKHSHRLSTRTRLELLSVAERLHIPGRSRLTKEALIEVIERHKHSEKL